MSESFVDRILVGQSLDSGGPLTRSLQETHTSGFIRDDAAHWSIESYIPLTAQLLIDYLISRGELDPRHEAPFRRFCDDIDRILDDRSDSYLRRFARVYSGIDPDADHKRPQSLLDADSGEELDEQATGLVSLCEEILYQAGFRRLETEEITRCVGVASQFGVPLHVDLDIFENLLVYARGDIIGSRMRRRLRKLYRRETVSVQVYQRMVVVFRLRHDDSSEEKLAASAVHLRMFKNIPKQDVDTLLPGTKVRISSVDRVKIIVPSLGGFLMSLRRIAQYVLLFAVITIHWSAILVGLLVGFLVKSTFSYFQTKNRYQLHLTKNLYFQKLDTNSGVAYHAIQQAHQQAVMEAILAQYAILTSDKPLSHRRLRRKSERLIREAINIEFAFQVDRAVEWLMKAGSVRRSGDSWIAEPSKFL